MNPVTNAANDKDALKCTFRINHLVQQLSHDFGFLMFSRSAMIVTAYQASMKAWSDFPMHQDDDNVKLEVQYMLAWLSCQLQNA